MIKGTLRHSFTGIAVTALLLVGAADFSLGATFGQGGVKIKRKQMQRHHGALPAQFSVAMPAAPNAPYAQDFSTYLGTAVTIPTGWSVSFTGTPTFNGVGNGSLNTGGAWAYGTGGENSFGALRSGTPGNLTLAVGFMNTSGATITDLTITFNYEQWRYVAGNTSGFDLSGTGGLAGNATVNAADFAGVSVGTNGVPSSTPISLVLSGLSIADGATFGLSWVTTDTTGSDNGVSIDDFTITEATVIPEPATSMLIGVGLLLVAQRFIRRKTS